MLEVKGLDSLIRNMEKFDDTVITAFRKGSQKVAFLIMRNARAGMRSYPTLLRQTSTGTLYYASPNDTNSLRVLTGALVKSLRAVERGSEENEGIYDFNINRSAKVNTFTFGTSVKSKTGFGYPAFHDEPGSRFAFFKVIFNRNIQKSIALYQQTLDQEIALTYGQR